MRYETGVMNRVGRPPDFDPEQRKRLTLVVHEAVEKYGKKGVRDRLKAEQPTLDRWLAGSQGMSTANARKLARLVGRTLEDLLGSTPDRQSQTIALDGTASYSATVGTMRSGVDVGLAALKERGNEGRTFPNLAFFLELNERRRPERRRSWSLPTIIAAAAGIAGDDDLEPEEWEVVLDRIEKVAEELRASLRGPPPRPRGG